MPADFERCRANGGKIRTKTIDASRYMRICILNGKTYAGEVKTKKTAGKRGHAGRGMVAVKHKGK